VRGPNRFVSLRLSHDRTDFENVIEIARSDDAGKMSNPGAARAWLGLIPSKMVRPTLCSTSCNSARTRGSPVSPSRRNRSSAPIAANVSNDGYNFGSLLKNQIVDLVVRSPVAL
jgi:hypothetical protein